MGVVTIDLSCIGIKFENFMQAGCRNHGLHHLEKADVIKVQVVTIDVSNIGIKFENFMQAGCRDLGSQPCTAESPLFCPNWYSFLEHFKNCQYCLPLSVVVSSPKDCLIMQ